MRGCLKWFIIIGIVALTIKYWYITLPVLAIILFISYKSNRNRNAENQKRNHPILPQNYDNMNGHEFEQYCADVLIENGFSNVNVTKGSGDFGIDILATRNGWKYAIQCKNYSSKVGNHAIQEVYSGKDYYNADIAVVITNNYFTPSAIETANSLDVELWDRDKLNSMINHGSEKKDENISQEKSTKEASERTKRKFEEHRNINLTNQKPQEEIVNLQPNPVNKINVVEEMIKEDDEMYDKEKGIYPSGEYLIGEDIPIGKYLLKQKENSSSGEIHIYKDYQTYLKNPDNEMIYKTFKGDYHLSLRTEGNLLVVENADMQKL